MGQHATMLYTRGFRNKLPVPPVENPIRTGIVGLGHRSVGNAVRKTVLYDEYELAAVCDIRGDLVDMVTSDLEANHGLEIPGYLDYDRMLEKEALDAVCIQVDADKQVPLACRAMEAGLHVMMEVPLAYSLEHCWQMVTTVERTGKIFMLMEQSRYSGVNLAWRRIVQTGVIGKPVFVEGEYFNYKVDPFFQDARGRFYTPEEARRTPDANPTWRHMNPGIVYLPHELSPLLNIIDDRVTRVVGMSTRPESYRHPEIKQPDIQAALMHTKKDVVMRMAVGWTTPAIGRRLGHWHHIKGTEGVLEKGRTPSDESKLWVEGWHLSDPLAVPWDRTRTDAPPEAAGSGHGDQDYYVFAHFADAVLHDQPLEFDIYKAVECCAPGILAARSFREDNMPQDVPDFRPGPHRKPGELPNTEQPS